MRVRWVETNSQKNDYKLFDGANGLLLLLSFEIEADLLDDCMKMGIRLL